MNSIKTFAVKNSKAINIVTVVLAVVGMVVFDRAELFTSNPALSIIAGIASIIIVRRVSKFTKPVTTTN